LSGGKRRQGIAAHPERRFPDEAFLTALKWLCKVKEIQYHSDTVHLWNKP
jgi:hypothetical protein